MSKSYLIVGGTSGIGAAVLHGLVERRHRVLQMSRQPESAPDHPLVTSLRWDVRTEPFPADSLPATLDGLVYCPGTIRLRPSSDLPRRTGWKTWRSICSARFEPSKAPMRSLKAADSASIVLFSTVAVGTGLPFHASIASAKGAVEGLTRALAAELAPRIRVNAVAPTLTATPLAERLVGNEAKRLAANERHPLRRIGEPEDVASAALWLLEEAALTTGQVLRVDAGLATLRIT
jgi:3-oxoacyl-[acyl-carrier protein] reductase